MKKKPDSAIAKASDPKRAKSKQSRHGAEPERLKIEGDWVKAVDHSLAVKRPAGGWPK